MRRTNLVAATLILLFAVTLTGTAQEKTQQKTKAKPKRKPYPAMMPVKDDPSLPRVLLIGDSISIGYTVPVREMLKGKANVHRPLTNCGPTTNGVRNLDLWLGDKKWDVIHFNFGLHDLKYMGPNGENLYDPEKGHHQVSPKDYGLNLDSIARRLKKTGAKVIWRNTTPVPSGSKGRVVGHSKEYNDVAAKVMKKHGIPTHDMFSFASEHMEDIMLKANVHFSKDGSKKLAETVVQQIMTAMPKKAEAAR
ncbi:MAG: SGNH/GDSL hydrolase family protein [Planctomycetaceae bacterium]